MRYCPECKVTIGEPDKNCPLCGTALIITEQESPEERLYPDFTTAGKKHNPFPFLARLFVFLSVIGITVCTFLDLLITRHLSWSLYVTGGIIVCWMTVGLHLIARINLNYQLLIDLCAVSFYLMLIDWLTGWIGWSVDYVIPILYIGIMITTIILALVFRVYWREYILSLVAVCFLGIGPLLIFFNSRSPIRYLCLSAALMAGALLVGILFFAGGKLFSEWQRRMNL